MYVDVMLRNRGKFSDMLFTYKVPSNIENQIDIGYRVSVPFGKSNKPIEAVISNVKDTLDIKSTYEIKEIFEILGDSPLISKDNVQLISWMRNRYICTYLDCMNLFYPKGYMMNSKKVIIPCKNISELSIEEEYTLTEKERSLLNKMYLSKKNMRLDDALEFSSKSTVDSLREKKLLDIRWEYEEVKNEKYSKIIYLESKYLKFFSDKNNDNSKLKLGVKQRELVNFLSQNNGVEMSDIIKILNISNSTIKSLVNKNIVRVEEVKEFRKSNQIYKVKDKKINLNNQQKDVVNKIIKGIKDGNKKPYLIHGVTGSGKTEVYLELIDYTLSQGMDSIFLVPEIALTPQTIARVKNRFGDVVGVYHSQLSEGEKHDVFREIKNGNIRVVIGTRSALFLPFETLGMVIIDEEHDLSYKSDKSPKYDAIEVARYMAYKNNIAVVLGSATPSVSDYYKAKNNEYILLEITERANKSSMPQISIVDMRRELHTGNSSPLSRELVDRMRETLKDGNQVILFLNKRGYANFMECKDCGHVFKCKKCDITLTNHKSLRKGVCHYCGYEENIPTKCPKCNMENISSMGIGTEKIEEIVNELFPDNKTLRIDRDSTSGKGKLQKILEKFNNKEADILIGTQMLSKGHDFENVTLVGIISADMMLNYPDFKSFEQTFQLITQVAGRAGRAEKIGKVVLQTYNTEHFAVTSASNYDYIGFYNKEINLRKTFGYEPFNSIIRVVFSGGKKELVRQNAIKFNDTIKYLMDESNIEYSNCILGPSECSINMIKNKYRWQIILKNHGIDIKVLKSMLKYICIKKFDEIFDKDIDINIEINPNTFI